MPVSHIGLTVSHLPTSCSFFLAALQPLGYRFVGQYGNQIGLGVHEADFFLTQETPGIKAGAAHVAFAASSRAKVRDFYANALQAGGRPHGSPAARQDGEDCFNAAVLDLDGNSVEVVFHEGASSHDEGASTSGKSRLLTWNDEASANLSDNKSAVSANTLVSAASSIAKKPLAPANTDVGRSVKAPSVAPSIASSSASKATVKATPQAPPALQRSFTAPILTPQSSNDNIQISRKTLVGTILGAAAGAAVAYAMCKSEEDSAKAEQAAYMAAQGATRHLQAINPQLLGTKSVYSSSARSIQNASEMEYAHGHLPVRAIEAAPPVYQQPSYTTVISGLPTPESTPPKSRASIARSQTYPDNVARGTIISSFVSDEQPRAVPQVDHTDHASTHSRAKSHHSKAKSSSGASKQSSSSDSKRSSRSKHRERSKSRTPQPSLQRILESSDEASKARVSSKASKASTKESKASKRTSVLGRSVVAENYPSSSDAEPASHSDLDTVVPSDSVSQIGSSSCRSTRRRTSDTGSGSHHTSASRVDANRRVSEDMLLVDKTKKQKKKKSHRASEAGSESTMTPEKFAQQYPMPDQHSITSLPIRGITASMVEGGHGYYDLQGHHGRSVASYYG